MGAILPSVIMPSDIRAVQARLTGAVGAVQNTVDACPGLDGPTRASWVAFAVGVTTYAQTPVHWYSNTTGSMYDLGLSYEQQILAWQDLLQQKGCALTSPKFDPTPPTPALLDAVKWLSIGAVAVAGAYGVSKLVEIIGDLEPVKKILAGKKG